MRPQQREVWRGGATSEGRVGNVIPLFGQKIEQQRKKEIHHGLKRPQANQFPHNNQPKIGVRNGGEYGGEVGAWVMRDTIVWLEIRTTKKYIYNTTWP